MKIDYTDPYLLHPSKPMKNRTPPNSTKPKPATDQPIPISTTLQIRYELEKYSNQSIFIAVFLLYIVVFIITIMKIWLK